MPTTVRGASSPGNLGALPPSVTGPRLAALEAPQVASHPRTAYHGVDPLLDHSTEPAPMGIADFGVVAVGANSDPYSYASNSFEGSAEIGSMTVSVATTAFEPQRRPPAPVVGDELFLLDPERPAHHRQHPGVHDRGGVCLELLRPGAHLSASEVKGANGSALASDTYYYIPGCNGLPGQCSTLSWPATILGRINVSAVAGVPTITYQYDLGSGWVTYDSVALPHMTGATITGFLVDGFIRRRTPRPSSTTRSGSGWPRAEGRR